MPSPDSPPEEECGSNAAGSSPSRRQPVPAIRARKPLPRSTSIRQAPALAGVSTSQVPGPQVRCPRAKTHRLPPAEAPSAPAIRLERKVRPVSHKGKEWGKFRGGGGREDFSRCIDLHVRAGNRPSRRRGVQAAVLVSVCTELCVCFLTPSCSRRIVTLRRLALKPTSKISPIRGMAPIA
ncbi:hypothetical protein IMCC20628_00466 [Hoeflea sp. IMCC20628]|nr:hypothetical protein IMCC20628_00466 [Hoeflea sp. IMCC20628]